jgi:preprotein translocase subunit SecD
MRALIRNLMLILTVIVVCIWSIIPPDKKLRLGKDLRGGVSLIYSVQIKPGDPPDVISRVIDVLKQRVDPNGLSEISIAQQGRDRIEITMPLPSKRVKLLKEAYDAELAKLGAMSLDAAAFERLMRLEGPARGTEIQRVAAGDQKRLTALTAASAAEDVMKAARAELNQAQADLKTAKDTGAEQARLDELTKKVDGFVEKVAAADLDYEAKRAACLGAVLSPVDVRLALEQSNQPRSLIDSTTGQQIKLPSPREAAIERLMTQHPDFKDQINAIIAAHARYASERTQLDDSADLKRLLAGAGVLDFRITVGPGEHPQESRLRREIHERGPQNVQSTDARWFQGQQD